MHHEKIRKIFFDYFKKHGHKQVPDAPLIPKEHDPSALFTNSGMHPLKPYFLGIQKPPAKRLFNIQKCVRTADIDDVGEDGHHLTFFFMLGNWSIGDYEIEGAVKLAYELLTKHYKLDPNRLWVSIFAGDRKLGLKKDLRASRAWEEVGIPKSRHVFLGASENFWTSGPTGPCGPTSEVFYDQGKEFGCGRKTCKPGCDCDRFLEIWNPCVQIIYNRDEKGKLHPLPIKSIDGGAGLERFAAVLQGVGDVFLTTLLKPVVEKIEEISGKKYSEEKKAIRVIADHIRAVVFITAEGVVPGRKDREYVLRRLLRRLIRYANKIGIDRKGVEELAKEVILLYRKDYLYLSKNRKQILDVILGEYDKFIKTLEKGSRRLERIIERLKKQGKKVIPGTDVFHLYDTFGFPMELTRELAKEHGMKIDEAGYSAEFAKHQVVSRAGLKKKFVSGLADHSEQVIRYHTATHLLHAALRKVLGPSVQQKGSNITPERLRFDFSWHSKLTPEQIKKVEQLVNQKIREKIPVVRKEMSLSQAKKMGALGFFDEKYGDKVSVYIIGDFSKEICAGPHVKNTGELGHFKIISEKSVGAGVRRIKAILE